MSALTISRPEETEYPPYYGRYISLVSDGDIVAALDAQ
ncbi:MAG: DinB family protein, partial [Pyrinomonadaceae bacterium]|nr:DinB family protein [Pyrinomonadaceae bacterium]